MFKLLRFVWMAVAASFLSACVLLRPVGEGLQSSDVRAPGASKVTALTLVVDDRLHREADGRPETMDEFYRFFRSGLKSRLEKRGVAVVVPTDSLSPLYDELPASVLNAKPQSVLKVYATSVLKQNGLAWKVTWRVDLLQQLDSSSSSLPARGQTYAKNFELGVTNIMCMSKVPSLSQWEGCAAETLDRIADRLAANGLI